MSKPILIIIGTKGQALKMLPVIEELHDRRIPFHIFSTNQHPIKAPKILRKYQIHYSLSLRKKPLISIKETILWFVECLKQILKIKGIINKYRIIIIHGDTLSTMLGLLAGKLAKVKVVHIESGLRSYSLLNPFPEEIIRRISCRFSDILFAPSDWAYNNLPKNKEKINTKNNTIIDTLSKIVIKKRQKEKYVVVTLHRQETLFNYLLFRECLIIINRIADIAKVKFVLHPLTEEKLKEYNHYDGLLDSHKIDLLPPQDYPAFMNLVANALFVVTDGGGLQEETYYLDVPCLILRKKTERQTGLNETAWLSKFEQRRIDLFLETWSVFKRRHGLGTESPSKIIVDYLERA